MNEIKNKSERSAVLNTPIFTKLDSIFVLLFIITTYVFIRLFDIDNLGLSMTLCIWCYVFITYTYMNIQKQRQSRRSILILLLLFISSIYFALFANTTMKFLNCLATLFLSGYWLLCTTHHKIGETSESYLFYDLINTGIIEPIKRFKFISISLGNFATIVKCKKQVLLILTTMLISLPLLLFITAKLAAADTNFKYVIEYVLQLINFERIFDIVLFVLCIPAGIWLFTILFNTSKDNFHAGFNQISIQRLQYKLRRIPSIMIMTLFILMSLLYTLFIALQFMSLSSVFMNEVSKIFSYSTYARQGFFELCQIVVINFIVIGIAYVLKENKQTQTSFKIMISIISILTLLLIISALCKMGLYINFYGCTRLRIYTSMFMITLFIIFIFIIMRQWIAINFIKAMLITCTSAFLFVCFIDVDQIIVKVNIDRYLSQSVEELDLSTLLINPDASIPYLINSYEEIENPIVKSNVLDAIISYQNTTDIQLFTSNYQTYRTYHLVNTFLNTETLE